MLLLHLQLKLINELEGMIADQQEKVRNLLSSVKDALLGFNSDELTVREENGKVYVAMSDKLLFQSGSATVDKRGKEALAKLAEVLNRQTNIDVYIEGHTDSKPIHNARFHDNWDLSVIRATNDGFEVARHDLQLRGPGEFLGERQSGVPMLRFADLEHDEALLVNAVRWAPVWLEKDREAALEHARRWFKTKADYLGI